MNDRIRQWIAQPGPMTDAPRMVGLYHLLTQVLAYDVPGDVVELGCHEGQSAVLLAEVLAPTTGQRGERQLHLYDSFAGLPAPTDDDAGGRFRTGWLVASPAVLLSTFAARGLPDAVIHEGWFADTLPAGLPDEICFAHLDCDLAASITLALQHVYPRLSRGAIVVVDDYGWEGLPGVAVAVDRFLASRPERALSLRVPPVFDATHAFFRRLA